MKVRPQIAALIVLLVVMGFVFVLVGEAGVSTDAIKPTPVASPTADAAAPVASGTAANWVASSDGVLAYAPDPAIDAQVAYLVDTMDAMAAQFGVAVPSDDAALPLLDLSQQIYDGLKASATDGGLAIDVDEPPVVKLIGDAPVAIFHVSVLPQETTEGSFAGRDMALGFAGDPEQLWVFQYVLNGEANPAIYQDFLAWMAANTADLIAPEAEATAEASAEATEAAEVTEPAPASTEPAGTEEAAPVVTEAAPVPEATEPAATEAAPAPEVTGAATEASTAEPDAAGTEEAAASDWTEVAQGVLMYSADPSLTAQIGYTLASVDQMVDPEQLATLPDDPAEQATAILQIVREGHETQVATAGIIMEEDAYDGPRAVEIGGVTGATLRVIIAPQSVGEQAYPGVDQELAIFPRDDGWMLTVSYGQQGEGNAAVYNSYRAWLEDHIDELSALEAPAAEATAEATEAAPAEASAPTAEATEAAD